MTHSDVEQADDEADLAVMVGVHISRLARAACYFSLRLSLPPSHARGTQLQVRQRIWNCSIPTAKMLGRQAVTTHEEAARVRPGCVQGGVQSQDLQMRRQSQPNMANQSIGNAK